MLKIMLMRLLLTQLFVSGRKQIVFMADVILTGDKDFLEAGLMKPRIMTATEFIKEMQGIT